MPDAWETKYTVRETIMSYRIKRCFWEINGKLLNELPDVLGAVLSTTGFGKVVVVLRRLRILIVDGHVEIAGAFSTKEGKFISKEGPEKEWSFVQEQIRNLAARSEQSGWNEDSEHTFYVIFGPVPGERLTDTMLEKYLILMQLFGIEIVPARILSETFLGNSKLHDKTRLPFGPERMKKVLARMQRL